MRKKIFITLIIILISSAFLYWVIGDTTETTSITFQDVNLYSNIKDKISNYIESSNLSTKTLVIRTQDIPNITSLSLSNCNISNLSGIENFTRINRIIFII